MKARLPDGKCVTCLTSIFNICYYDLHDKDKDRAGKCLISFNYRDGWMRRPSDEKAFSLLISEKYSHALDACMRQAEEEIYDVVVSKSLIVNIPKEILSNGIKQRIEDRCSEDNMLFRKMFLYSELFSLDKKSNDGQKKLLKK